MSLDDVPAGPRRIVNAIVARALARCEQEGIGLADFYRVMCEEADGRPGGPLSELFERVFRRLKP